MNEETDVMETPEMEESFNRHFIRIDEGNRIVGFFSDAFDVPPPQGGEADILINEKGGRHVRLTLDGAPTHENPWELIRDEQGVPLLKRDAKGKEIVRRAEEEIQADIDAIPAPAPAIPVEGRIKSLEKTVGYHGKVIEALMETVPEALQAQFQKAMLGAVHDG